MQPTLTETNEQGFPGDEIVRRLPFGALVIATLGYLAALYALLVLRWPVNPLVPTDVAPHLERILRAVENESAVALVSRLILNVGIYIIMLISLIALVIGWLRGGRAAARTLMLMACLGLMYVAGVALYLAGAVAAFGFCLMLFGSALGWVVTERLATSQPPQSLQPPVSTQQPVYADSSESAE